MPSLQFLLPTGAVNDEQLEQISSALVEPLLRLEGLPVEEPFLSWSWALASEVKAFRNGRRADGPLVRVDAITAAGLLDAAGKAEFVKIITDKFVEIAGLPGSQVLVHIIESSNLAFDGQIQGVEAAH
jgi:phenylpyruvate tautomerase PptA (4-oxalocrotonate tautomerase family)